MGNALLTSFWSVKDTILGSLSMVRDAILGTLSTVGRWIYDNVKPILDVILNAVNAIPARIIEVSGAVQAALSGLADRFRSAVEAAVPALVSAITERVPALVADIAARVSAAVGGITSTAQSILGAIANSIYAELWGLRVAVGSAIAAASDKIMGGIAAIPGMILKPLQDFFLWVLEQLARAAGAVGSFLQASVLDPIYSGLAWLWGQLIGGVTRIFDSMIARLRSICDSIKAGNPGPAYALLAEFCAAGAGVMGLLSVASLKVMGSGIDTEGIAGFLSDMFNPGMITGIIIGTLLGIAIREPLTQLCRSWFRTAIPGVSDVRTYYLRGLISEDEARAVLARHGLADNWIKAEMESWNVIPGVSDLVRFVVREVITPEDFYKWSAKQGLSEYWAKSYWEAHWVLPSFESLREAFWRGLISEDEYRRYIVWHDYKPEPRPGISKSDQDIMAELSYKLPGRIDVRWMMRWGLISLDEAVKLTKAEGMHPEWIQKVTEAEWLNMLVDERNALRSIYIRQYRLGLIGEDELRARLKACYFSDREVEWIIARARAEYAIDLLEDQVKAALEAYRRDLLTDEELLNLLVEWGVREERARLIVARESFKKLPRPRR